jgi:ribosomal protein S18 acetylase RimI-like enzyme
MLSLKRVKLYQILKLNKVISKFKKNKDTLNFHSEFNGNIFSYLVIGDAYLIMEEKKGLGILTIDKWSKIYCFFPIDNTISIFKLFHLLKKNFDYKDYSISLIYHNLNYDSFKTFFDVNLTENMMYMSMKISNRLVENIDDSSLLVRNMLINKEENIRVGLQNKIFNNIENRIELTMEEVLSEQLSPRFLMDFCYIFEKYREPVGYGQIIKFDNKYFLVNFGIISDYRNKGYGFYFLNNILRECAKKGIDILYLSVNKDNESAINLYKKIGFVEIYNLMTIKFN